MSDDNKILNRSAPPVVPIAQEWSQGLTQPVQPSNKEVEPITSPVSEFAKPSEVEPQIDKDLKELGIEAKKEMPEITNEHKELGIEHSGPIPVPPPSNNVVLSMSEEEIAVKSKTVKSDDSEKWYMALLKKIIGWERNKDK